MIKGLNSQGRYMLVSGGSSGGTYYQTGQPMAGMVRYTNSDLQVYDGNTWQTISGSYASVGLSAEAEMLLDWARAKKLEEEAMLPLPSDHPAVKIAKENLNKAKAEVMRAEQQLQATIILSKEYETNEETAT